MSEVRELHLVDDCPACGRRARWRYLRPDSRILPHALEIDCGPCDRARWLRRVLP